MPTVRANGVDLSYDVRGEGETVVLLHPVGLSLEWWRDIVDDLSAEFRVLAIDLRGHGASATPVPPWAIEDAAEDVHAALNQLGLGPAHVIGQSFGGMVAQALTLDHPEDVRSLVLSGTACTFPADARDEVAERGALAERAGMEAVVDATLERWFTGEALQSEVADRARRHLLGVDVAAWAATWRAIARLDTRARLRQITVPTLVLTGDADVSTPPAAAEAIAREVPHVTLKLMPGAPHMAPYERPELFLPPLLAHLHAVGGRA
jgi:3-oxoadipate enol-lactonase